MINGRKQRIDESNEIGFDFGLDANSENLREELLNQVAGGGVIWPIDGPGKDPDDPNSIMSGSPIK